MKISYFNYKYKITGPGTGSAAKIRNLATSLERRGHQVDLQFRLATWDPKSKIPGTEAKVSFLRKYGHAVKLILRNFSFYSDEKKKLSEFNPDVLLAKHEFCAFSALWAARKRKTPFVLWCDTPVQYEYSMFFSQYHSYPTLSRRIEKMNIRGAAQVICVTEILKGYMMRYGVPATKIHVIPNGVDHNMFKPGPPDSALQKGLDLLGRTVIGFFGSFNFFPNMERFIDVVKSICSEKPDVVFLFVGESKTGEQLKALSKQAGLESKTIFTGAVPYDQVPSYMSLVDVGISPYRGDYLFYGSALKPLEYMSAGITPLAPSLGQLRELITDGYNGMLYKWDDFEEFAAKLTQLIDNPSLRRSLGASARKTVEKGWTWDDRGAAIEKVLMQAIEAM